MISVVINTLNEEKNLARAIGSVKDLADETVVCDMESEDRTIEVAKKLGAKVYTHKRVGYVEPARNFAVSKGKGEWILILDADEEIPYKLGKVLKKLCTRGVHNSADYYRVPRKNIIFGRWIRHTRWWPDYNIRFFRKGFVSWSEEIHSVPITKGTGADLPPKEDFALIHHNYNSVDQYLERMLCYTKVQSEQLLKNGYVFKWQDLIKKPLNEFLGRFFVGEGYKDGIHGLALSFLQAFSELTIYLRVWEKQGFEDEKMKESEVKTEIEKSLKEIRWWMRKKFSWQRFLPFQ